MAHRLFRSKVQPHWQQRLWVLTLVFFMLTLVRPIEARAEASGKTEKFSGQVLTVPENGIGNWLILTDSNGQLTLYSTSTTRLDHGVLPVGSQVRGEGTRDATGKLIASRIRRNYFVANELVVRLRPGAVVATIGSRYGITVKSAVLASGNIFLMQLVNPDADVETLVTQMQSDIDVIWVEANFLSGVPEGHPFRLWNWGGVDSSGFVNQSAFQQINLGPRAAFYGGAGMDIAVLDTGIDLNQSVFTGRLVAGWDMVADDATPQDEGAGLAWGHGTHVAGIIARVASKARIMPLRVLDTNGRGNTFILAYAVDWAANHGAEVINLSLGSAIDSRLLRDTIKDVSDRGVIVVAAAGNANRTTEQFPAANPQVIGVTAVDVTNRKASFANYGSGWVDVAAPGVGITSTMISQLGSGYASWSGTSMATPFVSAAAAMVRQKNPVASVAKIEQLFVTKGRDLNLLNPIYTGKLGRLLDVETLLAVTISVNDNAAGLAEVVEDMLMVVNEDSSPPSEQNIVGPVNASVDATSASAANSSFVYLPIVER